MDSKLEDVVFMYIHPGLPSIPLSSFHKPMEAPKNLQFGIIAPGSGGYGPTKRYCFPITDKEKIKNEIQRLFRGNSANFDIMEMLQSQGIVNQAGYQFKLLDLGENDLAESPKGRWLQIALADHHVDASRSYSYLGAYPYVRVIVDHDGYPIQIFNQDTVIAPMVMAKAFFQCGFPGLAEALRSPVGEYDWKTGTLIREYTASEIEPFKQEAQAVKVFKKHTAQSGDTVEISKAKNNTVPSRDKIETGEAPDNTERSNVVPFDRSRRKK